MTKRQVALYTYLLSRANERRFITKEEICKDLPQLYYRSSEKTSEHNSTAYNHIRQDVKEINEGTAQHIIASSVDGYKIATKQEANRYITKQWMRAVGIIKRARNLEKKVTNDGQLTAVDDKLKELKAFIGE